MEAKALYDFQRASGASTDLTAGEVFDVEQQRQNGWTLVRSKDGTRKGWVPSTYLEILEDKDSSTKELARGLAEALKRQQQSNASLASSLAEQLKRR